MLTFLLFSVLCILGETESQNCTFPCDWQNKTFTLDGNAGTSFWNFTETTFTKHIVDGKNNDYKCVKIVGRFILVSDRSDNVYCWVINVNNADSFTIIESFDVHISNFKNECDSCRGPVRAFQRLSANQTAPACNVPVGCTLHPRAENPIFCNDNGNIERDCTDAATPPPPTTPPPKHCKHGHP